MRQLETLGEVGKIPALLRPAEAAKAVRVSRGTVEKLSLEANAKIKVSDHLVLIDMERLVEYLRNQL